MYMQEGIWIQLLMVACSFDECVYTVSEFADTPNIRIWGSELSYLGHRKPKLDSKSQTIHGNITVRRALYVNGVLSSDYINNEVFREGCYCQVLDIYVWPEAQQILVNAGPAKVCQANYFVYKMMYILWYSDIWAPVFKRSDVVALIDKISKVKIQYLKTISTSTSLKLMAWTYIDLITVKTFDSRLDSKTTSLQLIKPGGNRVHRVDSLRSEAKKWT